MAAENHQVGVLVLRELGDTLRCRALQECFLQSQIGFLQASSYCIQVGHPLGFADVPAQRVNGSGLARGVNGFQDLQQRDPSTQGLS